MLSDFTDLCKEARGRIAVPAVPLGAIERRAVPQRAHHRRAILAAVLGATSLLAAAVGAEVLGTMRFSFPPGGGLSMQLDESPVKLAPTYASLRAAVGQADFPVILPAGLPAGFALNDLGRVGRDVLILGYRVPAAVGRRHDVLIWLVNAKNAGAVERVPRPATYRVDVRRIGPRSHWRAGAEDVIVVSRGDLSQAQLQHVKNVMQRAAAAP